MGKFIVEYQTGVSWEADSRTLLGAKKEATKNACAGYGQIRVCKDYGCDPICVKNESDGKWVNL